MHCVLLSFLRFLRLLVLLVQCQHPLNVQAPPPRFPQLVQTILLVRPASDSTQVSELISRPTASDTFWVYHQYSGGGAQSRT